MVMRHGNLAVVVSAVLGVIGVAGWGAATRPAVQEAPGARTGTITGVVVDSEGKPRAGVQVFFAQFTPRENVKGESVATDDAGAFRLDQVTVGMVMVQAKVEGTYPLSGSVAVEAKDKETVKLAEPIKLSGAQPKDTDAQAKQEWSGYVRRTISPAMRSRNGGADELADLMAAVPASRMVTDEETWAKVWKVWTGRATASNMGGRGVVVTVLGDGPDKPPVVDFRTDLVLVVLMDNAGVALNPLAMDEKGDLTLKGRRAGVDAGNGGCGFVFAQVSRKGIKSVNGVAVPAAATQKAVP